MISNITPHQISRKFLVPKPETISPKKPLDLSNIKHYIFPKKSQKSIPFSKNVSSVAWASPSLPFTWHFPLSWLGLLLHFVQLFMARPSKRVHLANGRTPNWAYERLLHESFGSFERSLYDTMGIMGITGSGTGAGTGTSSHCHSCARFQYFA